MNMKKELSKGSSSLLVLAVISEGDKYGYQIIKEIEAKSNFVFAFKEGTLYPILHAFAISIRIGKIPLCNVRESIIT